MRYSLVFSPVLLASCWLTVPEHDAGDQAFAAQAIEAILGRKPLGSAEIRAYADIIEAYGRPAMVDVLFEQPEYVAYWSQVLADDLEVQRSAGMRLDANCGAPALLPAGYSVGLANHLANAPMTSEFCLWNTDTVAQFSYTEDQFWRAFEAAEANYPYTPVTKLPVPEPLRKPIDADPPADPDKRLLGDSKYPNLDADSATNFRPMAEGSAKVPLVVDFDRWGKLIDSVIFDTCPPFNLTDVLEASVRADRLDAAYRAYLPVFSTFPSNSFGRDELGGMFLDVYLDRDPGCMQCHNSTYSKTDPKPLNGNWDRFYPVWYGLPIPLDAEGTVFSSDLGGGDFEWGGDGGSFVSNRTANLFRADNHYDTVIPWGFEPSCVTNPGFGFTGFDVTLPADPFGTAAFASLKGNTVGVYALTEALSDATATFDAVAFEVPDWETYRHVRGASFPPAEDPPCLFCHAPSASDPDVAVVDDAPLLINRVPLLSDQRLFSIIRFGSGQMDAMADNDADAWDWVEWVRVNYPQTPALQMADRDHAFLYLLSANIVNNVVDEVLGENLVMLHGFPRNPDQSAALSSFALTFSERYSLQDLLREIVLSDLFNRPLPEDPTTDPYVLPMLPYPEAGVSPAVLNPPISANANSEGDFVHKHSPAGLLHQVHYGLGWPRPGTVGDPVVYPTGALMTGIGRYANRAVREREQFAVDTFLAWEHDVASCRKPEQVRARDVALAPGSTAGPLDVVGPDEWVDWIDLLAEDAAATGPTWETLAVKIKDRLLADPFLLDGEPELIAALWGLPDLTGTPPGWSEEDEDRLRDYCGALMATPDYLLRGVRIAGELPPLRGESTCFELELCGEAEMYAAFAKSAEDLGYQPVKGR